MTRPRFLTAPRWTKAGWTSWSGIRADARAPDELIGHLLPVVGLLSGAQPSGTDVGNPKDRAAFEALQNKNKE